MAAGLDVTGAAWLARYGARSPRERQSTFAFALEAARGAENGERRIGGDAFQRIEPGGEHRRRHELQPFVVMTAPVPCAFRQGLRNVGRARCALAWARLAGRC